LIRSKRPRPPRYRFIASAELTDTDSSEQLKEVISDLNLFGCYVRTQQPWPAGTHVRIRISHKAAIFEALGRIAYAHRATGMGITFTFVGPNDELLLESWVAALRRED